MSKFTNTKTYDLEEKTTNFAKKLSDQVEKKMIIRELKIENYLTINS